MHHCRPAPLFRFHPHGFIDLPVRSPLTSRPYSSYAHAHAPDFTGQKSNSLSHPCSLHAAHLRSWPSAHDHQARRSSLHRTPTPTLLTLGSYAPLSASIHACSTVERVGASTRSVAISVGLHDKAPERCFLHQHILKFVSPPPLPRDEIPPRLTALAVQVCMHGNPSSTPSALLSPRAVQFFSIAQRVCSAPLIVYSLSCVPSRASFN